MTTKFLFVLFLAGVQGYMLAPGGGALSASLSRAVAPAMDMSKGTVGVGVIDLLGFYSRRNAVFSAGIPPWVVNVFISGE